MTDHEKLDLDQLEKVSGGGSGDILLGDIDGGNEFGVFEMIISQKYSIPITEAEKIVKRAREIEKEKGIQFNTALILLGYDICTSR